MIKVVGFGALNVDNIFKVENLSLAENPAFPVDIQAGGNAANTVSALAKIRVNCGFIGVVANDAYGKLLISEFRRLKVNTSQIIIRKSQDILTSSGFVEAYVDRKGRRTLFVKPGVNSTLTLKEVNLSYIESAPIVHMTSFVDEAQLDVQKQIAQKISKNTKVSFSPGSLYTARGLKSLLPIIKNTYIFFAAKKEVYHLTGGNFKKAARQLLELGPKIVVITLGDKGCFVATAKEEFFESALKVKVVDTTGAGDAFAAGFLYGLLNNFNLKQCAQIGNLMASFSVQKIGARAGLPNRKELASGVSFIK